MKGSREILIFPSVSVGEIRILELKHERIGRAQLNVFTGFSLDVQSSTCLPVLAAGRPIPKMSKQQQPSTESPASK